MIKKSLVIIILLFSLTAFSQSQTVNHSQRELIDVLKEIEDTFKVRFSFSPELIDGKKIQLDLSGEDLDAILLDLSLTTQLNFNKLNDQYYYISENNSEPLQKVVIEAYLTKGITKNENGSFQYNIKKFGLLAGLTDNDILESIQLLPGIANIDESAANFYVRGGLPDQNRQIWDGINIYHSGHLFGLISPFNPHAIDKVTFYYKGTPPEFGERASSVIEMKTYENIPEKTMFEWGLNGIYSDLFFRTPIIKNNLSFQFSFRRSYEDLFETPVFTKYEAKAFQNASVENDFFYFKDYHFKLNFIPNKKHKFYASFLHIDNDLESKTSLDNTVISDILDTENWGYSVKWLWKWNQKWQLENIFSHSYYSLHYNNLEMIDSTVRLDYQKMNIISDDLFSTTVHFKMDNHKSLKGGLQFNTKYVDYQLAEKKKLFLILDQDQSSMDTYSLFLDFLSEKESYNFSLGIRNSYFSQVGRFKFEPRFLFNKKITSFLSLQFTGEIKNQIINHLRNSIFNSFTLEDKIWRLSDLKRYPLVTSYHITSGGVLKFNKGIIDFDFYYKKIDGISSYSLGIFNPQDYKIYHGSQKVLGFDLFIKKDLGSFKTRLSYTFSDVKNKFEGFNDSKYFTSSSDIRHAFNAGINYQFKKLNFAFGWIYRLGKPTSEIEDEDDRIYLEEINEYRLPTYNRLDFSSSYSFSFSEKKRIKGKIGLSVKNLLNNKIIINKDFVGNASIDDDIKILNYYSLGITPNIMFRIYW